MSSLVKSPAHAVLIAVFVVTFTSYLLLIGDTWTVRETVLAAIGTPAMVAGPIFLIAGLLTPQGPATTASPRPAAPRPA